MRIAVFRALHLGDLLCAVPAWQALRGAYPKARITLLSLPWARVLVDRYPQIFDDMIEFPGFPGLPEKKPELGIWPAFLSYIQNQNFDLILQMHGSGFVSNPLVELFRPRRSYGYYKEGAHCPNPVDYLLWDETENEVKRWLRLMSKMGVATDSAKLFFPITAIERVRIHNHNDLQKKFVCLQTTARDPKKCWPVRQFAQLGDELASLGYSVVLTGTGAEAGMVRQVQEFMKSPSINAAAWDLDLGSLGALLSKSQLLVTNDTGVSHLAAALQVPSLVIFTQTDPSRWAPLDLDRHLFLVDPAGARITQAAALAQDLLRRYT